MNCAKDKKTKSKKTSLVIIYVGIFAGIFEERKQKYKTNGEYCNSSNASKLLLTKKKI